MHRFLSIIALLGFIGVVRAAEPAAINFTGQYELTKSSKQAFSLVVEQKGKTATISLSASNTNGSGAAPDGEGHGQVNAKGELAFEWSDSFENSGTAVLRRDGKVFRLAMEPIKVVDSRSMVHYGDLVLKRTSTKVPTGDGR